ncbi:cell surface glycoprotein MUC18-like [Sinocyclocheilus grahami]|uniref:cell surface glycoprotein MUC18-like n=1 Tax=Sinocyclocheilus grahami TaxID=75366 RepID=UPI0007AC65BC|nr:PREDICTED: cell surface glycoprotein MUC18-like [Sinocyclocheilus grahami]
MRHGVRVNRICFISLIILVVWKNFFNVVCCFLPVPFSQTPTARKTSADNSGVIIVVIIVSILLLAILGSVFYFLYKKGKLLCGRSGKQEIMNAYSTKEKTNKEDIVVEMKAKKTEESVLLKGVNGEKKTPNDQSSALSS